MLQNEDVQPDGRLESGRPKSQQAWKETAIYSLQKGAGRPPVTKVFSQSGEGKHPKLSSVHSNQLLSSHLEQLLAGAPGSQQSSPGVETAWPNGKLHYLNSIRPSSDHTDQLASFGSKKPRPSLDRLLKGGTNRLAAKGPLNVVDGESSV